MVTPTTAAIRKTATAEIVKFTGFIRTIMGVVLTGFFTSYVLFPRFVSRSPSSSSSSLLSATC